MEAFWAEDKLYIVVDMYGFKAAYVSEEGETLAISNDEVPLVDREPAEEQALCDEFMADLAKTGSQTGKVLNLDHFYAYLTPSQEIANINAVTHLQM